MIALAAGACGAPSAAPGGGSATPAPATIGARNPGGLPAFYTPPNPLPAAPAGTLIRSQQIVNPRGVPTGAAVYVILYHSRTIYDQDIAISGYVVVPPAAAPAGGYPVLDWAHGTTGFSNTCAPSYFSFFTSGGQYLAPDISGFLSAGFVVAATDYQGLGTGGVHPYLLGLAEGRNVLDAARAAAQIAGLSVSHTVIVYGHSQGGHAALFAGELAPTYAPDLHVKGVVAAAPGTNLSVIMAVALQPFARFASTFIVAAGWGWSHTYHDLPPRDIFTPAGIAIAGKLVPTVCDWNIGRDLAGIPPSTLYQANISSDAAVLEHARLNDPGRVKTSAPLLVLQGTSDTTVPPVLSDTYVTSMACPIGDTIDYLHVTGDTHGTIVSDSVITKYVLPWIAARMAGSPAPTTCGLPGDVQTVSG